MSDKTGIGSPHKEPRGGAIIAGRYQVDRLIARGGMATVYLATHVKLSRPVALKILTPPPDADESHAFEERFWREGQALATLDHPNIVTLYDFDQIPEDGRFYLAMEFIDGPRMSDVLRSGSLSLQRALGLVLQVCEALRYAHDHGVIHRDLKPSNLMIRRMEDGSEQVKVVDFGLVKLAEDDQSITRNGLILGSPHCMSPEQVRGHDVDARTDIYAIGVLLFRAITGQYPFHGANSTATMIAHIQSPVPTFYSIRPDLVVPVGLEDVVRRCLAKSPEKRFQSTEELGAAVAGCVGVQPDPFRSVSISHQALREELTTEEVERSAPSRGSSIRTMLLMAGAALVAASFVVVLAAGLIVGLLRQATPPPSSEVPATADDLDELPAPLPPAPGTAEDVGEPRVEAAEPAPVPAPRASPAPVATPPAPEPRPAEVLPEPAPAVDEAQEDGEGAPEGYLDVPEDLFE